MTARGRSGRENENSINHAFSVAITEQLNAANSSPWIELRVDKIVEGLRGTPRWLPIARDIVFGHVLFHELGHHIHRTIRPEHTEKEDVADNWAEKLNANFIRKKYWYAMPMLVPMAKVYGYMRNRHWL